MTTLPGDACRPEGAVILEEQSFLYWRLQGFAAGRTGLFVFEQLHAEEVDLGVATVVRQTASGSSVLGIPQVLGFTQMAKKVKRREA